MFSFFVLMAVFSVQAHGLCDFPCSFRNKTWTWVINGFHFDATVPETEPYRFVFSRNGTYLGYEECFYKYGPFIVFGYVPNNSSMDFSCNYFLHIDENFFTVRFGPYVTVPNNETLNFCALCSSIDGTDPRSFQTWVAKENLELNCNVPKNCPSDLGDTQCSGREKGVPDDGYCCNGNDHVGSYMLNNRRQLPFYAGSHPGQGNGLPPWARNIGKI